MTIKFVSKAANYSIVLKHGIPAEPLTGRGAVSGMYVKFENGVVCVSEEIAAELKQHPKFGIDFICADEVQIDPFTGTRKEIEPDHTITNIKYGHVEGLQKPAEKPKFTPEQMSFIKDMVKETATLMAKEMAKEMVGEMVTSSVDGKKNLPESFDGPIESYGDVDPEIVVSEDKTTVTTTDSKEVAFICSKCGKVAKSNFGLQSHMRSCKG